MKGSAISSGVSETSQNAVSLFTKELIDELTREQFRLHAWQTLLSRSWARSLYYNHGIARNAM